MVSINRVRTLNPNSFNAAISNNDFGDAFLEEESPLPLPLLRLRLLVSLLLLGHAHLGVVGRREVHPGRLLSRV